MSRLSAVGAIVVVVAVAAAGFWAGRVALAPPADPLAGPQDPMTYEVVEQTVGQTLQFAALAEWDQVPLARAGIGGVVTSIDFHDGDVVADGDVIFTVNLQPVVIAAGSVPAFRDLQLGVAGADVRQLEDLLDVLGHLAGEPNDIFDESTADAVREWQRSIGASADGVVRRGDIIFSPQLPARIVATEALAVGAPLIEGELIANRLSEDPSMVVPLTPQQRDLVPLSGSVRVAYRDGTWDAVIARAAERVQDGAERLDLILQAPDGGPVCGDECAEWIPASGRTSFNAEVVVVPETTGPVVPVGAILTEADGRQLVELESGTRVPVEVRVSAGGLAVVSGLEAGDVVVLPSAPPGQ